MALHNTSSSNSNHIRFGPFSNMNREWTNKWSDHLTVDIPGYSLCIQLWILFINITISDGLGTAEYPRSSGQKED